MTAPEQNTDAIKLKLAHLHTPKLVTSEHGQRAVHGRGLIGRFNSKVAVTITRVVGTVWCAYFFTVLALVALPTAIHDGSPTVLVNWLSSNFLQLVLLPIIIVGQNVNQAANDARAEADHATISALLTINTQQLEILTLLRGIADEGHKASEPHAYTSDTAAAPLIAPQSHTDAL